MRSGTLGLFYFCKFVELIFLTIWSVLTIGSGTWLIQRILNSNHNAEYTESNAEFFLLFLIPTCLVAILGNLFYNNLLINLRFLCKMNCATIGFCIFDFVNVLGCYCILKKPCRDKCFSYWTIGKWIIKTLLFGATIYFVKVRENLV